MDDGETTDGTRQGDAPDGRPTDPATLARRLRREAERTDQRRLLVVAGDREATYDAARRSLTAADLPWDGTTLVGETDALPCERVGPRNADELLGTTRRAVVYDAHDECRPNAIGRTVGAVDGGGLFVLLTPPLQDWPDRRDAFDRSLAVHPYGVGDVAGRFRRRLVRTLRSHPGVAVLDADGGTVERTGLTGGPGRRRPGRPSVPRDARFPAAAYRACLTRDQARAVRAFEWLAPGDGEPAGDSGTDGVVADDPDRDDGSRALVVEADRGRGKSAAAGIAAAALAAEGADILVTAPAYRNAREVLVRARATLADLEDDGEGGTPAADGVDAADADGDRGADRPRRSEPGRTGATDDPDRPDGGPRELRADSGGTVRYRPPDAVAGDAAGVLVVDEAAALPVRRLTATLSADRVAYVTTVHGYEGTGRGFEVRFRDRLAGAGHAVEECRLADPVRYAPDDPVETWAFRALALDARPPVAPAVADATPATVAYRRPDRAALAGDEHRLREAFGLLARAHYRTEPDDLARMLDAPNLAVRTLERDGHVVSVALLAEEGGLPASVRRAAYEGERIRGHMVPDVLTSQVRDEDAGRPRGLRVVRIATHHAVRSRGLGSTLLDSVRREFGPSDGDADAGADTADRGDVSDDDRTGDGGRPGPVDYLGVGFGTTPDLVEFWARNGFRAVHLSVTRNDRSGEHSAVMVAPLTDDGRALADRHVGWFADRAPGMLSGPLSGVDPGVVRATLRSLRADRSPSLSDREWRVVAGAAAGPGLYKTDPAPFRRLLVDHLAGVEAPTGPDAGGDRGGDDDGRNDGSDGDGEGDGANAGGRPGETRTGADGRPPDRDPLAPDRERLLVRAVGQGRPVDEVAAAAGFHGTGECLRAVADGLRTLVEVHGNRAAREELRRYDRD